jgi:2-polyprenyl-6-hydroxyphenyl methylase/3-demethylubiquinone-9 3-methyltransferase
MLIPPQVADPRMLARVRRGELPARYAEPWRGPFVDRIRPMLERPDVAILDVGGGRRPAIPTSWRPPGTYYAGLDVNADELAGAAPGSYDEVQVGDIGAHVPGFEQRFDLVVSSWVLEHVDDVASALENIRAYLKPGGRMVAMFSGRYAAFALLARAIPHTVRVRIMARYMNEKPDDHFRTRYDRCTFHEMSSLLSNWRSYEIVPLYRAAVYFRPWRSVERAYLAYENWLVRSERKNLAPFYVIAADR